ncbi:MAG: AEC family transporter [Actinomycetota bacterium]
MSFLSLMIDVLGPVVAIVAVGALAGPRLKVDVQTLSRVAYWVLGPAFVFDLFLTNELSGGVALRLAAAAWAGMAAAVVIGLLAARPLGVRGRARSAVLMTGAYGNVGNAGLAVTAFALGDGALGAAVVLMLIINLTGVTLGVTLASNRPSSGAGAPRRSAVFVGAVGRAVLSPMPLAAVAAVAVNVIGVDVPLVIERSTGLLAGALIPTMLFTLGVQLAQSGGVRLRRPVAMVAGLKLLVVPAVAWAAGVALGLTGDNLAAVLIQSAMPPAVFCVLVGIEYDLEPKLVTDAVVATTVASLATLPVVLALAT